MFVNFIIKKLIYFLRFLLHKFGININFSSDGEDSIISKWMDGISNGFYIDVGSYKPFFASNTYGFYLNGWRGICIDPNPGLKLKYFFLRPLDLFINSALVFDDFRKSIDFYFYKNNTDLNTFSKSRVRFQKKFFDRSPTNIIKIKIIKINDIVKLVNKKTVHFLNIDIEGLEEGVVKSIVNKKIYPWCIAIEEVGKTYEEMRRSKIKKFLNKKGYILASKTFLTSIYIRKNIIKKLPSKYVKAIN